MTELAKKTVQQVVRKSHCYKEIACKVKKILDWHSTGRTWRCIVGNFAMFCEHQFKCSITFTVDDFTILIYQE